MKDLGLISQYMATSTVRIRSKSDKESENDEDVDSGEQSKEDSKDE